MEVRADTYLWAIRMYRSRTLAASAIKGGKVKCNEENVKASHLVRIGEKYHLSMGPVKRIIVVTALTGRRGSFETARKHYEDHSPPLEKSDKLPSVFYRSSIKRPKGSGRPTKKERRDLDDLWD